MFPRPWRWASGGLCTPRQGRAQKVVGDRCQGNPLLAILGRGKQQHLAMHQLWGMKEGGGGILSQGCCGQMRREEGLAMLKEEDAEGLGQDSSRVKSPNETGRRKKVGREEARVEHSE